MSMGPAIVLALALLCACACGRRAPATPTPTFSSSFQLSADQPYHQDKTFDDWYSDENFIFRQDAKGRSGTLLSSTVTLCVNDELHLFVFRGDGAGDYDSCLTATLSNCLSGFDSLFAHTVNDPNETDHIRRVRLGIPETGRLNGTEPCGGHLCEVWQWEQHSDPFCAGYMDAFEWHVVRDQDRNVLPVVYYEHGFEQVGFFCQPFRREYSYARARTAAISEVRMQSFVADVVSKVGPCGHMVHRPPQ